VTVYAGLAAGSPTPTQKVLSAKKRFQFLSKPRSVVLHHGDLQPYGGTSISGENTRQKDSVRDATFFSAFGGPEPSETAPRLVAKPELQLEGWTAASAHM